MQTRSQSDTQKHADYSPTPARPIIVATDGTEQSDGALAMARALAQRLGTHARVLAVYRPFAMLVPEAQLLLDVNAAATLRAELEVRVRQQCVAVLGGHEPYSEFREGEPSRVITQMAVEQAAQLVVVGLGRHKIVDRVFGSETALKVSRSSRVPTLAVPSLRSAVLRSAIVAVDFSEQSARAAELALRLVDEGAVVQLVHVVPRERTLVNAWISQREYDRLVQHNFTRLIGRLDAPLDVEIGHVVLTGDPAPSLLEFAARTEADLIVIGSHGHSFVGRMVLGSVTTSVLRGASCAVLVVPRDAFADAIDGGGARHTLRIPRARWNEVLDDFTRQNSGRRTRLEVDDPDLGAQAQEEDYPLRGTSYDPHDQRVEIMLGELGTGKPHISRSIGDVEALEILTEKGGKDIALRVLHGGGQTILTLVP
jgi:nucleotide-binding universal stress UspA family protein